MGDTTDLRELADGLEDLCPMILMIDGFIFLDREKVGEAEMRKKIAQSPTVEEAQYWNNIVPISDFISNWTEDEDVTAQKRVLEIFRDNWTQRIKAKFPDAKFEIGEWADYGDFGLRVANDLNFRST